MEWLTKSDAMATLERLVPNFKFLGAALWTAWMLVIFGCEVTPFGVSLDSDDVAVVYVAVTASFSLTLVFVGVFHKRVHASMANPSFMLAMGALASLGTALVFALRPLGGWWFTAGALLAGAGTAFIAGKSILQFAELGPREVIFMGALVQVAGFAVDYTVLSVSALVQPWLFVALPFLASVLLLLEPDDARRPVPSDGWETPRWFWRFVVGVLFLALPVGICRSSFPLFMDDAGGFVEFRRMTGVLSIASMVCFAVVSLHLSKHARYGALVYRVMLALSAVYVVLCAFGARGGMGAGMSVGGAVNAVLSLCVWVLLARIAFKSGASTLRVFGFGYASFMAGGTVGWGFGIFASVNAVGVETVVLVLVLSAIVGVFVVLFLFRQQDLDRMMRPVGEDGEGDVPGEGEVPSQPGFPRQVSSPEWALACRRVATDAGLSERETEVLALLACRMNARNVSDELCISYNTARNHIQRVYAKCSVHSKEELFDLVASRSAE